MLQGEILILTQTERYIHEHEYGEDKRTLRDKQCTRTNRELLSVNTLSSSTVVVGEVSTLAHELRDYAADGRIELMVMC